MFFTVLIFYYESVLKGHAIENVRKLVLILPNYHENTNCVK